VTWLDSIEICQFKPTLFNIPILKPTMSNPDDFTSHVAHPAAAASKSDQEIINTLQLAYRWGYPLLAMAINNSDFYGSTLNAFYNMKSAADEKSQAGKGFNAEVLYSAGALDLSKEPVVFSMPDVGDRFVVFPVQDGWGNIDNVIGTRTVGNRGGNFLISGPNWKGEVPQGMTQYRLASNVGFLPGRSMVLSLEDGKQFAATVQDKYTLTPLSRWAKGAPNPNRDSITSPLPIDPAKNYNAQLLAMPTNVYFNRLNALLIDNPPYDYDAPIMATFAPLGIGPGLTFDIKAFSADVQSGMATFGQTDPLETAAIFAKQGQTQKSREICCRFGTNYYERYLQIFGGLGGNLMEDAMYYWLSSDTDGVALTDGNAYLVHFDAAQVPKTRAFWSLTLYDKDFYLPKGLVPNRHVLNSHSGLVFGADGTLDIFVQAKSPGAEHESNWLPTPEGEFFMILRVYWPGEEFLTGKWVQPVPKRIG
jgi:hypothetical protein